MNKNAKVKNTSQRFCLLLINLSIILLFACKDEENNNIPLVQVYFQIQLNDPAYLNLKTIGGWEMVSGGSRGIILYRVSSSEIKAYDRHCTFQPSNTCALVSVDANNFTATDNCCGSSFLLTDGSVASPPANTPLKQYNTILSENSLIVTN